MAKNEEASKLSKSLRNIEGTKIDPETNLLLTSTGVRSFDELIGGGVPVGTLVLIEEDTTGTYSNILLKYFLAEGAANKHSLYVASKDISTEQLIQEIPSVIESDSDTSSQTATGSDDKMKIAFRYQNLPTREKQSLGHLGHAFDLTKRVSSEVLQSTDITHWHLSSSAKPWRNFRKPSYGDLLESLKSKLTRDCFFIKDKPVKRSILRVAISSLGSPLWGGSETDRQDLRKFFFYLRTLLRNSFAIGVVTVPSSLIERDIVDRCIYHSDIAIRLQAFSGTDLEDNLILSKYHGYFTIVKVAAINSFVSKHPGSAEYVFKLRRKKFHVEKLHLPPEVEVAASEVPSMSCGSTNKHLLEF